MSSTPLEGSRNGSERPCASRAEIDPHHEVLNLEEAARFLGVSVKTFNKVLHQENLPARKIGREWKFSRHALLSWLGSGESDDYYRESSTRTPQNGEIKPSPRREAQPPREPHQVRDEASEETNHEAAGSTRRRTSGWRLELD